MLNLSLSSVELAKIIEPNLLDTWTGSIKIPRICQLITYPSSSSLSLSLFHFSNATQWKWKKKIISLPEAKGIPSLCNPHPLRPSHKSSSFSFSALQSGGIHRLCLKSNIRKVFGVSDQIGRTTILCFGTHPDFVIPLIQQILY